MLLLTLVAILYTTAIVQYSLKYGRLVHVPTYEDSRYVTDGLARLFEFYDNGPVASIVSYVRNPPASPYSSYLAMAGFAFFGTRDWAPYACNGFLILGLLLYLNYRLRTLCAWPKASIIIFALTTPFSALTVHEYRPDLACGLATAIGIVEIAARPLTDLTRRSSIAIGAAFGFALLAKPSVFPGTLIFLAGALFISSVKGCRSGDLRSGLRRMTNNAATIIVVATSVSAPYFGVGLKYQINYLYEGAISDTRKQWVLSGSVLEHLRYYLDGPAGREIFRSFGSVYIVVFILAIAWAVLSRDARSERKIGLGLCCLLLSYIVPTAYPNKAYYGNATFAAMLLLYSCFWLGSMFSVKRLPRTLRVARIGLLGATVAFAGAHFQLPPRWGDYGSPYTRRANQALNRIASFLMDRAETGTKNVFLTTIGFHTDLSVTYLLLKQHFDPKRLPISQIPFATSIASYMDRIDRADIVVATETGTDFLAYPLPCSKVQDEVLRLLKSNPDFVEAERLPSGSGKYYYIFERTRRSPVSGRPSIVSVRHEGSSAVKANLVIEINDPGGIKGLRGIMVNVASKHSSTPSCLVNYNAEHAALAVSDGKGPWSEELLVGKSGIASGTQCSIDAGRSLVFSDGTRAVLTLALRFPPRSAGPRSVLVYAVNYSQQDTGWVNMGDWTLK